MTVHSLRTSNLNADEQEKHIASIKQQLLNQLPKNEQLHYVRAHKDHDDLGVPITAATLSKRESSRVKKITEFHRKLSKRDAEI